MNDLANRTDKICQESVAVTFVFVKIGPQGCGSEYRERMRYFGRGSKAVIFSIKSVYVFFGNFGMPESSYSKTDFSFRLTEFVSLLRLCSNRYPSLDYFLPRNRGS